MTHALHALNRFSAALTGWIPDLSEVPLRRQIMVAGGVSLLINLLVIIIVAVIFDRPLKPPPPFAKPKLRMRAIELTIVPPEPEPEPIMPFTLQQKPEMPFMDSRGLDLAREASLNPIFQADENMRAASELPATGDAPLPSQNGGDRPFNAFKTQRSLLGSSVPTPFPPAEAEPPLSATPPLAPAPPVTVQEPPSPPEPPPPAEKIAEKAEPAPPAPEPPMEPKKTPANPDDIAMTSKVPTAITKLEKAPTTPMPAKPTPALRPLEEPQQMAKLTTPVPQTQPRRETGYQPEQEMNRIEGNITNLGKKSVDAIATPIAKYRKQVNDAIGSRWYYYVRDPNKMSLISAGSARVSFFIDAQGQVGGITLESNTSNASFAEICTGAVRDAREQIKELKLPEDATTPLKDGRLECSLTFTFYNL